MRTHPVVGSFFILLAGGLFVAGAAAGGSAPAFMRRLPLPPEVVVPFVLWQLSVWAILFGIFFLRPRSRFHATRSDGRAAPLRPL